MGIIYATVEDNMNFRKFKTYVTGKYEPTLPEYFIEHDVPPFYDVDDNDAISYSTPATIIDMCYQETDFAIPDIHDRETIINIIKEYVRQARQLVSPPKQLEEYIRRCIKALELIEQAHREHLNFLHNKYPEKYQSPTSLYDYLVNERLKQ